MHTLYHRIARPLFLMPLFAAFLFAALATGCAVKKEPAAGPFAPGVFVSPDGATLDAASLATALARADYVLVGETHDNPLDHKAQAAVLDALAASGRALAVGLEMLPHHRFDAALRRFTEGGLTLDELPEALDWQQSWGYDFALYRPVFAAAARHGLPLYGINIENGLRRAVSRKGLEGLSLAETKGLPLAIVAPLPAHEARLGAFFSEHSAMIGKAKERADAESPAAPAEQKAVPAAMAAPGQGESRGESRGMAEGAKAGARRERFVLIQSLWDSVMAEQAARARRETGRPVVVLAGSGHVENGYGIAHRLRVYDPAAVVMTVLPFSGSVPGTADFYFHSPERKRFGLRFRDGAGSPVIESVLPGSAAEKAGLKAGDRVTGAEGEAVVTARDLHRIAVGAGGRGTALTLDVERDGARLRVVLE